MRRYAVVCAVFFFIFVDHVAGQVKDKDLNVYLDGVVQRGRALYAYDQAAWHGTDALIALHPDMNGLARYICMKTTTGWAIVFPKWNALHDKLLVVYEATSVNGSTEFKAVRNDPPREGPDDLVGKERALEVAANDFGTPSRSYNVSILPAEGGNLYVYLYPAQTKTNIWPIGGDVRYTISADGKRILEKRQLHKTILDMETDTKQQVVAGFHVHVLSDVPEDTDVLYVLTRKPSIPEYIGAGKRVFVVNIDGGIALDKHIKLPSQPK